MQSHMESLEQEVQKVILAEYERGIAFGKVLDFLMHSHIDRLILVMQENDWLWDTHWQGTPINTPKGAIIQILLMRFETTLRWPAWDPNMEYLVEPTDLSGDEPRISHIGKTDDDEIT